MSTVKFLVLRSNRSYLFPKKYVLDFKKNLQIMLVRKEVKLSIVTKTQILFFYVELGINTKYLNAFLILSKEKTYISFVDGGSQKMVRFLLESAKMELILLYDIVSTMH